MKDSQVLYSLSWRLDLELLTLHLWECSFPAITGYEVWRFKCWPTQGLKEWLLYGQHNLTWGANKSGSVTPKQCSLLHLYLQFVKQTSILQTVTLVYILTCIRVHHTGDSVFVTLTGEAQKHVSVHLLKTHHCLVCWSHSTTTLMCCGPVPIWWADRAL